MRAGSYARIVVTLVFAFVLTLGTGKAFANSGTMGPNEWNGISQGEHQAAVENACNCSGHAIDTRQCSGGTCKTVQYTARPVTWWTACVHDPTLGDSFCFDTRDTTQVNYRQDNCPTCSNVWYTYGYIAACKLRQKDNQWLCDTRTL